MIEPGANGSSAVNFIQPEDPLLIFAPGGCCQNTHSPSLNTGTRVPSAEIIDRAKEEIQKINKAYETIRKLKGW